jgi:lipoprotein-anchoring transpeptidase ErfK/SrfK
MRRMLLPAVVAISMAAAAPAVAAPSATPSRWANAKSAAPFSSTPGGAAVGKLHLKTEDDFREVYLVTETKGDTWVRVRIPVRPNGTTGWVKRSALGAIHTTRASIVVDRKTLRATLYEGKAVVWSARVGVGTDATPTPAGKFWVREVFRVNGNAAYGPYAIGTSAYSVLSDWPGGGVIGIHGTNEPNLIPGRPSHGCVRMKNSDVAWLATHIRVGTPITIR